MADEALKVVADFNGALRRRYGADKVQEQLDEAILGLMEYWERLSCFDGYDPIRLIIEARTKDLGRESRPWLVNTLENISTFKSRVRFVIHANDFPIRIECNISKQSTTEEVLFKLRGHPNSGIKLHKNARLYTGLDWKGTQTTAKDLKLMSGASKYCPKHQLAGFNDYLNSAEHDRITAMVFVFVDRNPCIHILLAAREWSRLFSLAEVIEDAQVIVLKGVDGTLYHGQQVVDHFFQPGARVAEYRIYRFDQVSQSMERMAIRLPSPSVIGALLQANEYVRTQEARARPSTYTWLIKIAIVGLEKQPSFDDWGPRPENQYKYKITRGIPCGDAADSPLHTMN